MRYRHVFRVEAPLPAVVALHTQPSTLKSLTPLPIRFHSAPEPVREGDEVAMTVWLGPIPARWTLRVETMGPFGFVDRQISGPFRRWTHRHTFMAAGVAATDIVDEIELALRPHVLWAPLGLLMFLGLPLLFAFRAWKTRILLRGGA
ncbi:MAG: hypothetical protein QHH80_13980 [Anaerolineae bacterium]|nr:hypothetical protein [Anaerolineae bacterium]